MRRGSAGSLPGAWFNVICCAAIMVAGVVNGWPLLIIPGILMEVLFVRVLVEIYKERRDA